jgi:hypothetical protein
MSNVGSAYAVLALQSCGELEGWPFAAIKTASLDTLKPQINETEHFWYRLAPEGPYIDSQRDNKAFGFSDGKIFLSEDSAKTWAHGATFADAENIGFSCILKNGNILFATRQHLFLSTDNLKTYRQIIVNDGGRDYLPHTPRDPDQPGWYFHPLDGVHTWEIDGKEMLVWGNYCNVLGGPVPVNIYYSTDSGQTVKIAYSFGRNPKFQEPGIDPSLYLGDPENSVICRHIHSVVFNPAEQAFYACTGDINRGDGDECHWMRGTYDLQADEWDWKVLVSVDANSRYKSGGISFVDGMLYWAAIHLPNATLMRLSDCIQFVYFESESNAIQSKTNDGALWFSGLV